MLHSWIGDASVSLADAATQVCVDRSVEHACGPRCYGPNGCEAVIYKLTADIRARERDT